MSAQIPPHDAEAESALLGALLLSEQAAMEVIDEHGFIGESLFSIQNRLIFAAIVEARRAGRADIVTVHQAAQALGDPVPFETLAELQNATPAISNVMRYAETVERHAFRRRAIVLAAEVTRAAFDPKSDIDSLQAVMDSATADLAAAATSRQLTRLFASTDELLPPGASIDDVNPQVIPALLRAEESLIMVGRGGHGKSTLLRQFGFCAENGLHALTAHRLNSGPRRALLIEAEAKAHNIYTSGKLLQHKIARRLGVLPGELRQPAVGHLQGGIDIRDPRDRAEVVAMIRKVKPSLVCIGPLKYLFSPRPGELADQTATEVQKILNGIMERYGCAMVIEAHSNKSDRSAVSGSERWADWPDIGFAISTPDDLVAANAAAVFDVDQNRVPRNPEAVLPRFLLRAFPDSSLPWGVKPEDEARIAGVLRRMGEID